jgi:integrase/recombinase XerD
VPVTHKRKARLQKRVKINGQWCSRPAEQVKNVTGIYVVCHWENGRLVRRPVGTDLRKAEHERNRQNIILNARAAGITTAATDARHSLSGAISDYIAHLRRRDLTEKSISAIENILALLPQKYLEEITVLDVAGHFVDKLRAQGLAKQTIYDRYMKAVSFLKWCEKIYGVKRVAEMCDGPQKPKHSSDAGSDKDPYTPGHLKALNAVSSEEEQLYWKFFLASGAREREMTTCEWSDLDLDGRIFKVRAKPGFTPKGKRNRDVPLPQELIDALAARRAQGDRSTLVFGKDGRVQRHIIRILKARAEEAKQNPDDYFLHRFRHTAANRWLRNGIDIATVSNWLGHESLETTKLYLKAIQRKSPATRRLVDRSWKS